MVDVAIVGGGAIGCSVAVHLLQLDSSLDITIVEKDPDGRSSESPRGSGGVRQLFTCPENIQLSQYTLEVIENWPRDVGGPGSVSDLGWEQRGYLFVCYDGQQDALARNLEIQHQHGVDAVWLDSTELESRYPGMQVEDLGGGVLSKRDGWHDPTPFFHGIRSYAKALGAEFITDEAADFEVAGSTVKNVRLGSGRDLAATAVVNAAGCWAAGVAEKVGMHIPVEPMRRFEHAVSASHDPTGLPFLKDTHDLAVRTGDGQFQVGLVDWQEPAGFNWTVDESYFDRVVGPALAHRYPGYAPFALGETWSGHYDRNRLDKNAILGNWPGKLENFYLACGTSGHGLMHAPGVGRGIAELIVHGHYVSVDLSRLGYERVLRDEPYRETGIV